MNRSEGCQSVGVATGAGLFEVSRRGPRNKTVRIVEVTPVTRGSLPRKRNSAPSGNRSTARTDAATRTGARPLRMGFTRDLSDSGMCLGLDEISPVGSLLQVTLQDLEGSPRRQAVGRVVWSRHDTDSRFWHGLELLGNGPGPLAGLC